MMSNVEKAMQDLLLSFVKYLARDYSEFIEIDNDFVNFDENYIFLDSVKEKEDFNNIDMYKLYLKDFEVKCKEFIGLLIEELPLEHICFSEFFVDSEIDSKEPYYKCCNLSFFMVNKSDKFII